MPGESDEASAPGGQNTSNGTNQPLSNATASSNADSDNNPSESDDTSSESSGGSSTESNPPGLNVCAYEGNADRTAVARESARTAIAGGYGTRLHEIEANAPEEELIRIRGSLGPGPHRFGPLDGNKPEILTFLNQELNADCSACGRTKTPADSQAMCRDCYISVHTECINTSNVRPYPSGEEIRALHQPIQSNNAASDNGDNTTNNANDANGASNNAAAHESSSNTTDSHNNTNANDYAEASSSGHANNSVGPNANANDTAPDNNSNNSNSPSVNDNDNYYNNHDDDYADLYDASDTEY